VRVYQLKDRKSLDSADYQMLLRDDSPALREDMLASRSLLVMPGGNVTLNMPMDENAAYVAVVALFRQPDLKHN
ncbi:type VI secretion system lipoprotein TssJ, partial [Enterobacter sp. PTB]|uniref:type VI secretion system lipoprotein TssJ n=1 Tax=Enterobacter sp. PTB TaxID=3143437 RepID=UPI003DA821A7